MKKVRGSQARVLSVLVLMIVAVVPALHAQTFSNIPALSFTAVANGANPLPQLVTVASTGAAMNFSVTPSTSSGGSWLTASPTGNGCCTTPEGITVSVNVASLAAGTYSGQIIFAEYFAGTPSITVPVTLTVAPESGTFFGDVAGQASFSMATGGGAPPSQSIRITNGGTGTLSWTVTKSTADGGSWLNVPVTSGTAPAMVTVGITPSSLPGGGSTAGTFIGQLLFQTTGSSVTIPVSVTVGTNAFTQINPINFTMPQGGDTLPQVLSIASTGTNFNFSSAVYTGTGGNWLSISNPGNGCCTTPEAITVSVDATVASALAPGTYVGEIVFLQYFQDNRAMTVPVSLTVAAPSTKFFDSLPGDLSFYRTTSETPAPQAVNIRNGGTGTLTWTATASTADGGKWLKLSAPSGTAPSTLTVSIIPAAMPGGGATTGTFDGQVVLKTGNDVVTIPVSVVVGANVFAQVNPIAFTVPEGGNALPQVLAVASTGANFNFSSAVYTASGGNWLTLSNLGNGCCTTPDNLTVGVDASTLSPGIYAGEIVLKQYFQQTMGLTVPVTLTVIASGSAAFFDSLPGQVSFSLATGAVAPAAQNLQIRNAGSGTLRWTGSTTTADGGKWLTMSALTGTAPSTVRVSINPAALPSGGSAAGTFNGQVVLQTAGDQVTIPVSVTVGANVFAQVNAINFTMLQGAPNPLPQILDLASTGSNFNFSSAVYTASGGNWLSISNLGNDCCTTPGAITVSVNASTLLAGTYTGEITFVQYFQRTMLMTVPVTLTVVRCGALFDNVQGQVSFSFAPSTSNPPSQTVKIRAAGSGTLSWTLTKMTSDGGNWLTTSATGGNAPSTVTIGVNTAALPGGGLTSGTFTGELVFKAPTGNVTIPVSVLVGANVFSQGSSLSFSMTLGGSNPLSQIVAVASTGSNFSFSASATTGTGGAWLKISPTGTGCCSTPSNITASVSASTLPAGIYTGQITFIQYFQQTMAMTVPVTLTITDPHIPATIKATGGTPQSVTVNKNFASLLLATVQDASANPVSGVLVTFNPPTTGASGTFACGNTAVTNANGIATAQVFKANTIAGKYTVTATANALTTSPGFVMTNNPGPPASIAATAGTPQSAPVNTAFATNLAATVTDVYGNPVPNNTVTFSAPTSGASGSFAGGVNTAKTNSAGVASAAVFKANTVAGSYTVTAGTGTLITNPGFALTNLAGAPATITATGGTPQTTAVNTAFANPLQATVNDSFGNPVAGATVTFTAPTSGASGTFAGGVNTANTNSAGVATSAVFTANGTAGSYTVTGGTGTVTTSPGFQLTNQ